MTRRFGVVDADREFVRGKAAEHHRVDGADAGAGEHRDGRLGDHRHVDDHAVALLTPSSCSPPAKRATSSRSSV